MALNIPKDVITNSLSQQSEEYSQRSDEDKTIYEMMKEKDKTLKLKQKPKVYDRHVGKVNFRSELPEKIDPSKPLLDQILHNFEKREDNDGTTYEIPQIDPKLLKLHQLKEILSERFTYNIKELSPYHSGMKNYNFQLDT